MMKVSRSRCCDMLVNTDIFKYLDDINDKSPALSGAFFCEPLVAEVRMPFERVSEVH